MIAIWLSLLTAVQLYLTDPSLNRFVRNSVRIFTLSEAICIAKTSIHVGFKSLHQIRTYRYSWPTTLAILFHNKSTSVTQYFQHIHCCWPLLFTQKQNQRLFIYVCGTHPSPYLLCTSKPWWISSMYNKKAQLTLSNPRDVKACENCSNPTCFVSFPRISKL